MIRTTLPSKILMLAVVGMAAVTFLCAQTTPTETAVTDTFAGTWQAQFQGKSFASLLIQKEGGKYSGSVSHSHVELDSNGELTAAEAREGTDAITEATESGKSLKLTIKDADSSETTKLEMQLTGTDQADLQFIGLAAGTIVPKPWKLVRANTIAAGTVPSMKQKLASAAQTWLSGQFGNSASASMTGATANSATTANSAPSTASLAPVGLKLSEAALDAALRKGIDGLPRRVNDKAENQGDMTNFVIVGSEKDVQSALEAAKWNLADIDSKEAALKAILQTYQKKDYLAMPMSQLYLFGRVQDFGYEQAEAYSVVASRHHFRLWKAPFTFNDKTVWVGAGTHDIGFEKDQRNGKVTHKIDPAVDGERDHIGQSLQQSGKVKSLTYYVPPNSVQDARNATGGGYHSDGRVLVIQLQ
jgi:hypothetical protein